MTSRQERAAFMALDTAGGSTGKSSRSARNASGTPTRKAAIPAAHEVKELRVEAQRLDEQFTALCAKWRSALPEHKVLLAACTAAKQKAETSHVEQLNLRLKDELLQQQLYFSALQQKLTEAPLWSRSAVCQDLFDRVHGYLHLVGSDPESRRDQLQARFELGVRLAPEIVENFTREFVPLTSPVLPFSRTSTAATTISPPLSSRGESDRSRDGSVCGTLVSNVFVCKVPASASIPRIYQTTVDNLKNTSIELERRLGVLLEVKVPTHEIEMGPSTYYARVERQDGEMRGAHTNRAWTGRLLSEDLAVIVTDFVDEDDDEGSDRAREDVQQEQVGSDGVPLVPPTSKSGLRIDICSILTIARVKDPETQEPIVLMRRLRVHRYNLPPNSPVIHRELNKLLSYFNGDFHMAMLSDAYMNMSNDDHSSVAGSESVRSEAEDKKVVDEEDTEDEEERSVKKQKTTEVTDLEVEPALSTAAPTT
ncbi:hypothetical protein PR001_g11998 [Phytophthora rubi]|uniref:Uncharacterized protein n=1 Tax=Phytophthora rubi TaxID=129364 RepID=A0A6A3M740_9STRA|nr:hypothetical protein PR001_g11998 [Phytophthora rubi]KAE9028282.1 hypothetical protein PR002_g10436 [Phytophthora rubi]